MLARLLGLRLLTLDATVTLVPAEIAEPPARPRPSRRAVGSALPQAVRTMGEGERLLAESRRDGRGA